MTFKNRIIGEGLEAPENLLANPLNFRTHPPAQQDALKGVLNEVGFVQRVIVNQRTGYIVDGHARVMIAMRENQKEIPVLYVDLSEAEEKLVLATLDPIGALAGTDTSRLEALLREVNTGDPALQKMLSDLARDAGVLDDVPAPDGGDDDVDDQSKYKEQYGVIVICKNEHEQEMAYNHLQELGYECRVVCT